ncbi:MAG: S41 family peptidase [Balneolaceae bacterium]|nr:S41 family peptidase [Balneolaceae bacterium]
MRRLRKYIIGAVSIVVFATALIGAVRDPDIYFLIKKNFTIFSEVYREVSLNYVDEVDPQKLMRKGVNSMLSTLDPYTIFIDESQNENMEIITRSGYGGVGLDVGVKAGKTVVITSLEGYSAYKKGIRTGDIIREIDGISVDELAPEEVQNLTNGEPGTKVSMTIERYGVEQQLTFELKRERIQTKNITYNGLIGPDKNVGYILLNRFGQSAANEVKEAIDTLQAEQSLHGLVLDLRNNPGGLLQEAVGIVDKFIDPGMMVVETRGRLNEHNNSFGTQEVPMAAELPLVVLQNGGSASASEIVAGALQDYDRAVIVGEQSFGKGLVQIVKPLSYNTSLKLTVSRYYIPSGRSIQSVTYTHDENNTTVNRPDSLRKSFKTQNGRTVYDGEGIAPDIELKSQSPSLLETVLRQQGHFFQFANQYVSENEELSYEELSPKLLVEFEAYLEAEDFDYETQTQQHLEELEKRLANQNIKAQVNALKSAIAKEKQQHFEEEGEALKKILYLELVSRYQGTTAQTKVSLNFDVAVEEALSIINNANRYNQILGN